MKLSLFDDMERSDEEPAAYAESKFAYLNRTGRPEAGRVRQNLEGWFSRYPKKNQAELRSRFRSLDNRQHLAAFFELALHELLLRLGHEVDVHPASNGSTSKRPDFLVTAGTGDRFYMEAVLATDQTDQEAAAQTRLATLQDLLNRMDSPNFFLGFRQQGTPTTPFPAKKIRAFLERNLRGLNPDQIADNYESGGTDALPHWPYNHAGCSLIFFPIPKSQGKRGKVGVRPVGMYMQGPYWIDPWLSIRNAITKKATRYGKLDLPYVIAVNFLGEHLGRIDILEALFGEEQSTVSTTATGPGAVQHSRVQNGAWTSKKGSRYTTNSAVLLCHQLLPSNVPHVQMRLYHNPWSRNPYGGELTQLPQAILEPDLVKMKWVPGETLARIFGLPAKWPYADAGSEKA